MAQDALFSLQPGLGAGGVHANLQRARARARAKNKVRAREKINCPFDHVLPDYWSWDPILRFAKLHLCVCACVCVCCLLVVFVVRVMMLCVAFVGW